MLRKSSEKCEPQDKSDAESRRHCRECECFKCLKCFECRGTFTAMRLTKFARTMHTGTTSECAIDRQRCGKNARNSGHIRNVERAENTEFNKFNWRSSLGMQKFRMRFHCARMQSGRASNGYLTKLLTLPHTADCLFFLSLSLSGDATQSERVRTGRLR